MLVCHKLSGRDKEFNKVISVIFELEKTFALADKRRQSLFDARKNVTRAKFLNQQFEEAAAKEKIDLGE